MTRLPTSEGSAGGNAAWLDRAWQRYGAVPVVVAVLVATTAAGAWLGPSFGVLVLAGAALAAAIAALWLSLRSLLGDRRMAPDEAYGLAAAAGEDEQKRTVLRALEDLDYERRLGKISTEDYEALRAEYRARAQELLEEQQRIDRALAARVEQRVAEHLAQRGLEPTSTEGEPSSSPTPVDAEQNAAPTAEQDDEGTEDGPTICPDCDTRNDRDARFCKHCGEALGVLWLLGLAGALALWSADVVAQPAATTSAPAPAVAASPAPTGSDDAPPLPPGHPPTGGPTAVPEDQPMLPPGHPDISGQLGRSAGRGMPFRPPADSINVDRELPRDTVVVHVVDGAGHPRSDAPVTLHVLHRSVNQGESSRQQQATTNAEGVVRFEGLEAGSAVSYRVTTERGPALYSSEPFGLAARAGLRILLHAFDFTADPAAARVDVAAFVVIDIARDALNVDQVLRVLTVGPDAWVPEQLSLPLPEGYRAFRGTESMDSVSATLDEERGAVVLSGTFDPGQTEIRYGYQIPLAGDEVERLQIPLPARVSRARVIAHVGPKAKLQVDGFPAARSVESPDGKRVQVTERQLALGSRGLDALRIGLEGLPSRGIAHVIALLVALTVMAGGLSMAWTARRRGAARRAARRDWKEARQVLLDEVGALERLRRDDELPASSYAAIRGELLDALARLERRIEGRQPAQPKRKEAR